MKKEKTLIEDLLTENRFWTFSSTDWKQRVNIVWGGKTNWEDVVWEVRKKILKTKGEEIYFERQVELTKPDLTFN